MNQNKVELKDDKISTCNYITKQLRGLAEWLFYAEIRIFDKAECQKKYAECTSACKAYAICHATDKARYYLWKKDKGA